MPQLRVPPTPRLAAPAVPAAAEQPAPTVVEVTIGRLEVRTPPAPAAAPAPRKRENGAGLTTYLRRREKGELG